MLAKRLFKIKSVESDFSSAMSASNGWEKHWEDYSLNKPFEKPSDSRFDNRWMPEGFQLIAKADIYADCFETPILLLSAGRTVNEDLLEKLIRYGATPDQFVLQKIPLHEIQALEAGADPFGFIRSSSYQSESLEMDSLKIDSVGDTLEGAQDRLQYDVTPSPVHHAPETTISQGMSTPLAFRSEIIKKSSSPWKVLIWDSEERSQRRLIDCLTTCGFPIVDIHAILSWEQLPWSLAKYSPRYLFIDYQPAPQHHRFGRGMNGLDIIEQLYEMHPLEMASLQRVIMTVSIPDKNTKFRNQILQSCASLNVIPLFKPLNRFMLGELLEKDSIPCTESPLENENSHIQ